MLHIATPLYRYELLPKVYDSIPKETDITWHIAKTSRRPKVDYPFLHNDNRINLYEVDCEDSDTVSKRNVMFDNIKDGYFHLLDDDTVFVQEMYEVYKKHSEANFIGMVIGYQLFKDGRRRLYPAFPTHCQIDSGNVLCHHSVLDHVRWRLGGEVNNDFVFWDDCFKYFGWQRTKLEHQHIISIHNALKD